MPEGETSGLSDEVELQRSAGVTDFTGFGEVLFDWDEVHKDELKLLGLTDD